MFVSDCSGTQLRGNTAIASLYLLGFQGYHEEGNRSRGGGVPAALWQNFVGVHL